MKKKAFITGITGQDGSYLAEFLLEKGYEVHGLMRRISTDYRENIEHIRDNPNFFTHYGDMTDAFSLMRIIDAVKPCEIYNLAAQSHVKYSFDIPSYTADSDAMGALRLLEAIRVLKLESSCRFYQASTSELYGKVQAVPQNENTPFYPYSPYAVAKLYAYWIVKNYRDAYGIFASNGILFNHESERRSESFVTRKITVAVAKIVAGLQECLYLGNLNAYRDWGYAKDYIECMWLMLQHDKPDDFVIATGKQHSVRDFCKLAFEYANVSLKFEGEGINEVGINKKTGKTVVKVSPEFYRPTEVETLLGDPSKAVRELNWNPHKTSFNKLVKIMVEHDLKTYLRSP